MGRTISTGELVRAQADFQTNSYLTTTVTLAANGNIGDSTTITHNLGYAPTVTVLKQSGSDWVDATGNVDITHNTGFTQVTVTNAIPFSATYIIKIFSSSTTSRAVGILVTSLTLSIFLNNSPLSWSVQDGLTVPDSSISAGIVYFNEIPSYPGFYSVRLFPDRVGYWRIVLVSASLAQESSFEFDVVPANPSPIGLTATFTK
jgi:hypothetical protein